MKKIHTLNSSYFPKLMNIYKIKNNLFIVDEDVQNEDIDLSDFYYQHQGFHTHGFVFTLPKNNHLQNLLTLWDILLNETTPERINLFSKSLFKLPQETLIKTVIDNYVKN